MMIYTYLQRMDQDRLARLLGDAQLAAELPELPLTTAAKRSLCPAELGRKLLGDDRGCEELGRRKAASPQMAGNRTGATDDRHGPVPGAGYADPDAVVDGRTSGTWIHDM